MLQQPGALVFISSMMGDLAAFESPWFSLVKFERSSTLVPCSSMFTIVYQHVLEDIEGRQKIDTRGCFGDCSRPQCSKNSKYALHGASFCIIGHHGFDFTEAFWAAHDCLTIAPPSGPSWASPFHGEGSSELSTSFCRNRASLKTIWPPGRPI